MEILTTETIRLTDEENECLQKARDLLIAMNRCSIAEGEVETLTETAIYAIDDVYSFVEDGDG